jgi:hypothetical protein
LASINLPPSSHSSAPKLEKQFRSILIDTAKHNIPSGRHIHHAPGFTPTIKQLLNERDALRSSNAPATIIAAKTETINNLITSNRTEKWQSFISNLDPRKGTKKLWRAIKSLNGQSSPPIHSSINFNGK